MSTDTHSPTPDPSPPALPAGLPDWLVDLRRLGDRLDVGPTTRTTARVAFSEVIGARVDARLAQRERDTLLALTSEVVTEWTRLGPDRVVPVGLAGALARLARAVA